MRVPVNEEANEMMRYVIFTIWVLLFGSYAVADDCKSSPCIAVDIYYESLCPYSVKFIRDQLVPPYPDLKNYLDLNFIPYGKATYELDESNKYVFKCQHGPAECQGNKAQVCGYEAILNSNTTFHDKQTKSVDLIGCAMSSKDPVTAVPGCAESIGLNAEIRQNVTDCIGSEKGDRFLAAYGDKTSALKPPIFSTGVPTIVLDHVYSTDNDMAAIDNFKKLICNRIPAEGRPTICAKETNVI